MSAVEFEHFAIAHYVRSNGASLDFVSGAALGEEQFVRNELVREQNGLPKEAKYYALLAASKAGEAQIVTLLLDAGVPVDGIKNVDPGTSPPRHFITLHCSIMGLICRIPTAGLRRVTPA